MVLRPFIYCWLLVYSVRHDNVYISPYAFRYKKGYIYAAVATVSFTTSAYNQHLILNKASPKQDHKSLLKDITIRSASASDTGT